MQLHIPPAHANSDQPLVLLEEHATNYEQATARATTAIGAIRYLSDIIATKVAPKQIDPDASIAKRLPARLRRPAPKDKPHGR